MLKKLPIMDFQIKWEVSLMQNKLDDWAKLNSL